MSDKVKIKLTPYNALTILSFCREWFNAENANDYRLAALTEAVNEYEVEIYNNITMEMIDEAVQVNNVNKLIGKCPPEGGLIN